MFKLTDNIHPNEAYITEPIDESLMGTSMQYFDKDGYELNKLEQLYYERNKVNVSEKHLYHTANHVWWIIAEEDRKTGPVLDHSLINTRWAYAGEAREQIIDHLPNNPLLKKLLDIKPKYGIDFSLDWIDEDSCFELFHIELDRFNIDDIRIYKDKAERIILETDWESAGLQVKSRKAEWSSLSSDDQSDWKARYFGWHRAFDNRKVYAG